MQHSRRVRVHNYRHIDVRPHQLRLPFMFKCVKLLVAHRLIIMYFPCHCPYITTDFYIQVN